VQQKTELWARWRRGESLSDIGRALCKHAASVFGVLRASGGISPRIRKRNSVSLTLEEREGISRGLAAGKSVRTIAAGLGRSPSTVSREVVRNRGRSRYRAAQADERACQRSSRPKESALGSNTRLRALVAEKLKDDWSPQQIAGWLAARSSDPQERISHETIYRSLYMRERGALGAELLARLRTHRKMRKSKRSSTAGQSRGQIRNAVSIHDRPAHIETRIRPGHWEGDLITGARNSHIATLVERYSRYVILVRVDGKDTASVVGALVRKVNDLPRGLLMSLTWDRGTELAMHELFTRETGVPVYFCDPKSPWQRGTNENTNGLLRQYFPAGLDFSSFTEHQLDWIAHGLNGRPRKVLGFLSPRERITGAVAPTR
jgi:IS30 family transposase